MVDIQETQRKRIQNFRGQRLFAWIIRVFLGAIEIVLADVPVYRKARKGRWYKVENIHESECFEWVHESDLFYRELEWDEQIATPDVPANK